MDRIGSAGETARLKSGRSAVRPAPDHYICTALTWANVIHSVLELVAVSNPYRPFLTLGRRE